MFKVRRQLRENDFDTYEHLNQAVYHVLLEDVRVAFVLSLLPKTFEFVVARSELDYVREVPLGEAEVEVGVEVARVGRSSFAFDQKIWRMDGELAAKGLVIFAAWDMEHRTSRPLTEAEKAALKG